MAKTLNPKATGKDLASQGIWKTLHPKAHRSQDRQQRPCIPRQTAKKWPLKADGKEVARPCIPRRIEDLASQGTLIVYLCHPASQGCSIVILASQGKAEASAETSPPLSSLSLICATASFGGGDNARGSARAVDVSCSALMAAAGAIHGSAGGAILLPLAPL